MIGIRPPAESGDGAPTTRHPRLVHDEMEAIFGAPSGLNSIRRGYSAGVSTHMEPALGLRHRMGSPRLWAAIVVLTIAVLAICGLILASGSLNGSMPQPAQLAQSVQESPYIAGTGAPTEGHVAPPADITATQGHATGTAIAAPLPKPLTHAPARTVAVVSPQDMPAKAAAARVVVAKANTTNAVATDADKANAVTAVMEAAKHGPCGGTSYQYMATCPPVSVRKADSALSAAYAAAISANVDPGRLSTYSQRWSQLRETASASPDATADEFANMTSQLNALTLAQSSRKK